MKRILFTALIGATICAQDTATLILANRLSNRTMRYPTFHLAMQLMEQHNARVLVETGCARFQGQEAFYGDGASTVIFGHWAQLHNAQLYSVDINPKHVANAQDLAKDYSDHITVTASDSVPYLQSFDQQIDFLYLDSFDFDDKNPEPSQLHHLKEIEAVYDKLTPNSIVMIDDCGLPHGGKGKYVIEYLLERGWRVVTKGYQVILVR